MSQYLCLENCVLLIDYYIEQAMAIYARGSNPRQYLFWYSSQVKMAFTFKTVLKNLKNNNILGHENHLKFKFQCPEITFLWSSAIPIYLCACRPQWQN